MNPVVGKTHCGFSRDYRLTTKADYTAVFNLQLKISREWFLALYKPNQKTLARIGIVISKRIIKKATARNYLKRVIRERFRLQKSSLSGLDIVILVRKGCKTTNRLKLQKELDALWQRLALLSRID